MPDRYKLEIQSDIENIENEMNTKAFKANTSCTYFEVCRSTLKLDEMKVYPNPASSTIAFDFVTSQALEGKISLVNIAGQELKVLQTNTKFVVGVNHFDFDVSDIPAGIYLLTILTDKGFRTQRVIISR